MKLKLDIRSFLARIPTLKILPGFIAFLLPLLIPPIHISVLWYFWQSYARYVDKRYCSCSCWDTVFKATYESGIASYKNFYFNATTNTLKIWCLTIVGIISLYESVKYLVNLMLVNKCRQSMVVLFMLGIFAHYYAFWAYVNYLNDEYYAQWNHQLFFTITELFSTAYVLHLANKNNDITSRKILYIVGIAILHIWCASVDQFVNNVFRGEGYAHQVVRDLGFMIPDVMHLCIPLCLLSQTRRESLMSRPFYRDRVLRKEIMVMFLCVTMLFVICSLL